MKEMLNILIIDDSQDDRDMYVRALKKVSNQQYCCIEASDGKAGLDAISDNQFDVILLDYSLPGMNGLQVLKKIRTVAPYLPVILLTGQGNEMIAVEAIKEGANDYMPKSFVTSERLHHTLKSAISYGTMKKYIAEKDEQIRLKTLELALSEERHQLVVQSLSVGIWDWNIRSNQLFSTPAMQEVLCFSDEDLANHFKIWEERLHPDDKTRVIEILQQHLLKKDIYDVEYRLWNPTQNHYKWIHAKGQAVWNEMGQAVRMVGSVEDITWRKEAEIERESMIAKLIDSNSDLEHFAYVCSHDLQEPLRTISNYTQRLEQHLGEKMDEKGRHYMRYIKESVIHARSLIREVLNYARVDNDNDLVTDTDSGMILSYVLGDLRAIIEESNALVTHDTMPMVHIKQMHLRQIIQNLIGNALKFSKEKPHVHISCKLENGMWKFGVRDNGIGIQAEYLDKIFVIFQRLHSNEVYAGTGIGLALCKKIVQKYNGSIWVESEVGKGSVFYFTLPTAMHQQTSVA
jgi:two-component system, chemotaxis family, CheB/CheR fusion protein